MSKYKEAELEFLSEKIDEFSRTLYAAQMKKFDHVSEVYDSEKLSGLSLEEVKTILRNKVQDHIDQLDVNVHNVTPEQLNTLSSTVLQNEFNSLLDKNSDLPLSYYAGAEAEFYDWDLTLPGDVPCMINGSYGRTTPGIFKFNQFKDMWGEWHIWLHKVGNEFRYKLIKEDQTQPDANHLYLGYMHTKGRTDGKITDGGDMHVEYLVVAGGGSGGGTHYTNSGPGYGGEVVFNSKEFTVGYHTVTVGGKTSRHYWNNGQKGNSTYVTGPDINISTDGGTNGRGTYFWAYNNAYGPVYQGNSGPGLRLKFPRDVDIDYGVPGLTNRGLNAAPVDGIPNTGQGGSGVWSQATGSGAVGGAGAAGVVIFRYKEDTGIIATGGIKSTWGDYIIHEFREDGKFDIVAIESSDRRGGVFEVVTPRTIAVGGYRLSKWGAGKSIPLSEGPVNASKYLNWV